MTKYKAWCIVESLRLPQVWSAIDFWYRWLAPRGSWRVPPRLNSNLIQTILWAPTSWELLRCSLFSVRSVYFNISLQHFMMFPKYNSHILYNVLNISCWNRNNKLSTTSQMSFLWCSFSVATRASRHIETSWFSSSRKSGSQSFSLIYPVEVMIARHKVN